MRSNNTSRLVNGDYPAEKGLNITYGYNKERRRDLKQFKIGLVTNALGYPLLGEILDGNLDDKSWNRLLLNSLPEHFTPEKLKALTYVTNYVFVTANNLFLVEKLKLKFISCLPGTYDLIEELTRLLKMAGFDFDIFIHLRSRLKIMGKNKHLMAVRA